MDKIFDLINKNRNLAFATIGNDGKPKIRVFEVMKIDKKNNLLYFATAPGKKVFKELQNNHSIELLVILKQSSIRITGEAVFNVPIVIKQDIYSSNPILLRLYGDYDKLVYFKVSISSLHYYDLNTNPPTILNYKF